MGYIRQRTLKKNQLESKTITLSLDAKALWIEFYNQIEKAQKPNEDLFYIRPFASKILEHIIRISGALALFEDLNVSCITLEIMKRTIEIGKFYLYEALRINETRYVDKKYKNASNLFDWLRNKNFEKFTTTDVYQKGPCFARTSKQAKEYLEILQKHNYIKYIGPGILEGKNHKEIWEINNIDI